MLQVLFLAHGRIPIPKFQSGPAFHPIRSASPSKAKHTHNPTVISQDLHKYCTAQQQLQLRSHRTFGSIHAHHHIPHASLIARRTYSAGQNSNRTYYVQRRWHVWFDRLCLVALGCLSGWVAKRVMALYMGFRGMLMWPEDIREDVSDFLGFLVAQDFDQAGLSLRSALVRITNMPVSERGSNPHLKLAGLILVYARVLERNDKETLAYNAYNSAWEYLRNVRQQTSLTEPEIIRMMAIAAKLGVLSDDAGVEMKWMSWAVDECRKWKQSRNVEESTSDGSVALESASRKTYEDVLLSPELRPSTQLGFPRDHWNMDTIMFYQYFPHPQWDVETNPGIVFFLMGRVHERQKHSDQALSYYFEAIDEPNPCTTESGKELALTDAVANIMQTHPIAFGHTKVIAQSITDCTTSVIEDWVTSRSSETQVQKADMTLPEAAEQLEYSLKVTRSFSSVCSAYRKTRDTERTRKMLLLLTKLTEANLQLAKLMQTKLRKEMQELKEITEQLSAKAKVEKKSTSPDLN